MRYRLLGVLFFWILSFSLFAQVPNDICLYATPLPSTDNYCSEELFTNVGAEEDAYKPDNTCFLDYTHAVWFTFTPMEPAAVIRITGDAGDGTLHAPQVAVFSGSCDNNLELVGCAITSTGQGVIEMTVGDLVIGQTYFLMVDGFDGGVGSFQICINDFIPIPFPQADCNKGILLCDKTPFQVESLVGTGDVHNEIDASTCIQAEFASSWYKWTCDQSGSLTFTITPNNNDPSFETDDIDFALYRLPGGLDDCANKELVRCMASGANQGGSYSSWAICNGPTGLNESSTDISEAPGCNDGSDNFVAALDMVAGESYVLIVLNFSRSGLGFSMEFGGTGTFKGPNVDFAVDAVAEFECDKTITFTDSSYSDAGDIVSWSWNFGAGADPVFADTTGPFNVTYESFGDKIAALTIESEAGCKVTKVIDFYVEPCCDDFTELEIDATWTDNPCAGDSLAEILGQGFQGTPTYSYSLDGQNFQLNPKFPFLPEGDFTVFVQDIKGCRDSIPVVLVDPIELIVTAGPDMELVLGDSVVINASYFPEDTVDIQWFGNDMAWLNCDTCLWPIARPFRSTEYKIQVTNQNGCVAEDSMRFKVNIIRPFYAPNAFSPNGDGANDFFSVFSSKVAVDIESLRIFDRWGTLIYENKNVRLNQPSLGWDGTYKGKALPPDVYVWVASVRYIDGVVLPFAGDVTIMR